MEHTYYRIGEVSQVSGVSKDTLHFYSKIGLLVPDYIDANNQYRYYSLKNLWQLDIITTCRKLNIPLEIVKQILSLHDNGEIVKLLMEYRKEAIRFSNYYQQVADDILWYGEENERIRNQKGVTSIQEKFLEEEIVIAGNLPKGSQSYHAGLQEVVKDELKCAPTIRRKYGYIIDTEGLATGKFVKCREYLKMEHQNFQYIAPDSYYIIPAGKYAVFTLHIQNEEADFTPLVKWLQENNKKTDAIYAEEIGLQLFPYINNYYCEIKAHLEE